MTNYTTSPFPRKNRFDPVNRVVITTIQRLYSVLTGQPEQAVPVRRSRRSSSTSSNQNLVMEYTHEETVADRVNVPYDVYEIKTRITAQGSKVDAGYYFGKRSRKTRAV